LDNVSKLEIKFDNKVVACDINYSEETDEGEFIVNGKKVTAEDENGFEIFRLFYEAVAGVSISNVEIDAVPKGDAEITFTYTLKTDPYTMKVEFIPKDQNYYYVMKNGKYSGMVVAKSEFAGPEGLIDTYKELMDELQ
jgi:hypothetical protein